MTVSAPLLDRRSFLCSAAVLPLTGLGARTAAPAS